MTSKYNYPLCGGSARVLGSVVFIVGCPLWLTAVSLLAGMVHPGAYLLVEGCPHAVQVVWHTSLNQVLAAAGFSTRPCQQPCGCGLPPRPGVYGCPSFYIELACTSSHSLESAREIGLAVPCLGWLLHFCGAGVGCIGGLLCWGPSLAMVGQSGCPPGIPSSTAGL